MILTIAIAYLEKGKVVVMLAYIPALQFLYYTVMTCMTTRAIPFATTCIAADVLIWYATAHWDARPGRHHVKQWPPAAAAAAGAVDGLKYVPIRNDIWDVTAAAAPGSGPQAALQPQSTHARQPDRHHAAAPLCCASSGWSCICDSHIVNTHMPRGSSVVHLEAVNCHSCSVQAATECSN